MANLQQHQQQPRKQKRQQNHQNLFFIYSTSSLLICSVVILLLCCPASGEVNAAGHHDYNTEVYAFPKEHRPKRSVVITEKKLPQTKVAPNANVDSEDINKNQKILMNQLKNSEVKYDPFRELNIIKRAPNGFIGMRGKKLNLNDEEDDYKSYAMDWNIDPLYRAKSTSTNDIDNDYSEGTSYENTVRFKKAPTAFYGVRGKKLSNHESYSELNGVLRELQQERLRDRMLQDFIGRLAVATADQNEIIKRAPTGFTGLRGKRPAYDWNTQEMELTAGEATEKRVPANFVGVRGKKDVDNQSEMEQEHQTLFKRSPSESFGSGKRRNGEFNNKFVAVRGKKDMTSTEAASYNAKRLRYLYLNSLPALIYGGVGSLKRAPSGFIGMRGKRSTNVANEASF